MFSLFAPCLGIDLGTTNTLVCMKGKGIILREPSVVIMRSNRKDILAVGAEAKKMIGKTPCNIVAVRPMKDGVISDLAIAESMLKYFIRKSVPQGTFLRQSPRLVVCVPCGITEIEKRAVEEAARSGGAREVVLLEEPMAAAIGAGIDIHQAKGSMIVDIGGGTTEVAVISLGGIVTSRSLRVGGNRMDEAIIKYIRKTYGMIVGESTAEQVKIEIGYAAPREKELSMEVKGRSFSTGLPISFKIPSSGIKEALAGPVQSIIDTIKNVLENTPPELAADIINEGIVMSGGGSMLHGFNRLVAKATGMPVRRTETPLDSVALGAGIALDQLEQGTYGQEPVSEAAGSDLAEI
jgi:rod shape-determining protein MreB